MNLVIGAALATAVLTLTSACGGDNGDTPAGQGGAPTATGASTASQIPSAPQGPQYAVLPKADLDGALLTLQDMPVGYSQDPPRAATTKTFCDYKTPFAEKVYVSRDFTKGGGMSTEFVSVGLRQYASAEQARAAFDALATALKTCKGENYEGTKMKYALMSAPKVGDASIGVRITADDTPLMQNFALVGPTLVNAGGGGVMQADADQIASLLEAQVESYQAAASN